MPIPGSNYDENAADTSAVPGNINVPGLIANAANLPQGTNPAYTLGNFLATFPQFAGQPASIQATATAGSNVLTVAEATALSPGMLVVDQSGNIPDGSTITSVAGTTVTLSANAANTGGVPLLCYQTIIPVNVLLIYRNMAMTCIKQVRWHSIWPMAMAWFIAHFVTLYLQSMAAPGSPAAQVMAAGTTRGILTSKSVGDVAASYESITKDLDGWAAWQLTIYGQQLATHAKMLRGVGMYVW